MLHGFVPDLDPLYRTVGMSIVPLLAGSGTRLKILEALARAVPVVSTSIGAEGLQVTPEHGVDLADAPEAFVECCVRGLTALEAGVSRARAGRAFVATTHDWRVVDERVADLARALHSRRFPPAVGGGRHDEHSR